MFLLAILILFFTKGAGDGKEVHRSAIVRNPRKTLGHRHCPLTSFKIEEMWGLISSGA